MAPKTDVITTSPSKDQSHNKTAAPTFQHSTTPDDSPYISRSTHYEDDIFIYMCSSPH